MEGNTYAISHRDCWNRYNAYHHVCFNLGIHIDESDVQSVEIQKLSYGKADAAHVHVVQERQGKRKRTFKIQ